MAPLTIYIPGNVPSSKNGKIHTKHGVFLSPSVRKYLEKAPNYFQHYKKDFLQAIEGKPLPYRIGFKFVRDSKRKFDYANAVQTIQDLMTGGFKKKKTEDTTHRTWIPDDNADILLPVFEPYEYKKNDGGVYIIVY